MYLRDRHIYRRGREKDRERGERGIETVYLRDRRIYRREREIERGGGSKRERESE